MELKNYQKAVMHDLTAYLTQLNQDNDLFQAWNHYWDEKGIAVGLGGVPAYNNAISGVPHVCMKVPTGGGKTFMACAAVRRILSEMPEGKSKIVVWLVPSDSILLQTIKNLSDPEHPYRRRLNADFAGRVGIYTKEMLLTGQNFSPDTVREMLTVCILSYGSLRINSKKKDVRKIYQENGNLLRFAEYFKDDDVLLADTPDSALIQVLRHLSPIVIVDESHNAGSDLSVEMLNNLNPSFVLDLTATPRKNSNIISYVDARELKKENMVKLPVIVYNRNSRNRVIQDAIQMQGILEKQAMTEEQTSGRYIRPIVLFQAQPKTSTDSETFEKIKRLLLELNIPEEQIAIKTSKVDTLGKANLMQRDCPIRFIITVNALKEGWDCPFAYILASLANKTSKVDVEQILGRILRQPYAMKHASGLLNTSYVFTKKADCMKFILGRYGVYGAMEMLELNHIHVYDIDSPSMDPNLYYTFTDKHGVIKISVLKELFERDNMTQSFCITLSRATKKHDELADIYDPRYWTRALGGDFMSPTLDKGIPVLDSLESIYDLKTKASIRLPMEDKENVYCILRWMMREFNYLRVKDNLDISTKRPRMADEYLPSIYAMKISRGIYRISDKGKNVTFKDVTRVIDTAPTFILKNINSANLVDYVDLVNDNDAELALSYTYKGISGLGDQGNGSAVPLIYRSVHPSHLGGVDLDSSSASDPGLSGTICPMAQVSGDSFSDYKEPNGWKEYYDEMLNNLHSLHGIKETIEFQKKLGLNYDYVKEDMVQETIESYHRLIHAIIDLNGKKHFTWGAIITDKPIVILKGDDDGIGEVTTSNEDYNDE